MKILCVYPEPKGKDFFEEDPADEFEEYEDDIEVWTAYCYSDAMSYIQEQEDNKTPFSIVLTDAFIPQDNGASTLLPLGLEFISDLESTLIRGLGIFLPPEYTDESGCHSQYLEYHAVVALNDCVGLQGQRDWRRLLGHVMGAIEQLDSKL